MALQESLRTLVTDAGPGLAKIQRVAGLDVTYSERSRRLVAAVVVVDAVTLDVQQVIVHEDTPRFPYVPGLFSFREAPPLLAALEKLDSPPCLLMCDGHGAAHPRRFGLACHLGVLTGIPSIGVAKQVLVGHFGDLPPARGSTSPMVDDGDVIGRAVRTATGVKPVYVSIGNRISLDDACEMVLRCSPRYRVPEPIRQADQASRRSLGSG